jgi:peptidyl-prolyl cis-trans isomerase SurA
MRLKLLIASLLMTCGVSSFAQDDPTVMTINGQPVSRSEFEYSYNKNNAEGVIDKKSVDEYVDLFINYKLKVQAALDAHMDTLSSFKKEFLNYRNQQVKPSFVSDADMEVEAHKYYDELVKNIGPRGLFQASHILIRVDQNAPQSTKDSAKVRIDSIYSVVKFGADFQGIARKLSQDPGTASRGGELPTLGPNQTVKEFEDVAYALQDGQISMPFLSPFGYHIIKMIKRSQVPPYDSLRANIVRYFEQRNYRDQVAELNVDRLAKDQNITKEDLYNKRVEELSAKDSDLKNLVREYHDGLLLFEISNRIVWEKASNDETGLEQYFKKNKKKYKWDSYRFKGAAYHVKTKSDIKAVRDCIKRIPFKEWASRLRSTFNNDSIIRIRVEKGIFKEGDNSLVDREIFKKNVEVKPLKDYPYDAVFGKKLKAPAEMDDVRGQVVADYQDQLEKEWVNNLRKKYSVSVNKHVLATVNKH